MLARPRGAILQLERRVLIPRGMTIVQKTNLLLRLPRQSFLLALAVLGLRALMMAHLPGLRNPLLGDQLLRLMNCRSTRPGTFHRQRHANGPNCRFSRLNLQARLKPSH